MGQAFGGETKVWTYISYRYTQEDLDLTLTATDESLAFTKEKYQYLS